MTIEAGGASNAGLIARAKGILLTPKTEWEVIDTEPATIKGLYVGYAAILAAIPAVSQFISSVIGFQAPVFGVTVTSSGLIAGALVSALCNYALTLGLLYVLALIADALAP